MLAAILRFDVFLTRQQLHPRLACHGQPQCKGLQVVFARWQRGGQLGQGHGLATVCQRLQGALHQRVAVQSFKGLPKLAVHLAQVGVLGGEQQFCLLAAVE